MNKTIYESGSFRDPAGRIFFHKDSVYRDIFPDYKEENFYKFLSKIAQVDKISTISKYNRKIYEYTRI